MALSVRSLLLGTAALALPFGLSACGDEPDNEAELAVLDESLTEEAGDPAMNDALSDQILVDPELAGQANGNALRGAEGAADGAMPGTVGGSGDANSARQAAEAQFSGSKMMSAPAPRQMTSDDECSSCGGGGSAAREPTTLGARAEAQAQARGGSGSGTCDAKVSYDMGWAERMPAEFPVYPRGNLKEAAGADTAKCNIRVVSFTTPVGMKSVVDYYYTRAKRGGYSAEYLLRGDEHVLGGTRGRDDAAYVIFLNPLKNGRVEVDIVASNGG